MKSKLVKYYILDAKIIWLRVSKSYYMIILIIVNLENKMLRSIWLTLLLWAKLRWPTKIRRERIWQVSYFGFQKLKTNHFLYFNLLSKSDHWPNHQFDITFPVDTFLFLKPLTLFQFQKHIKCLNRNKKHSAIIPLYIS